MIFETNLEPLLCRVDEPLYYSREELIHIVPFSIIIITIICETNDIFFYDGCLRAQLTRTRTEDHRLSERSNHRTSYPPAQKN